MSDNSEVNNNKQSVAAQSWSQMMTYIDKLKLELLSSEDLEKFEASKSKFKVGVFGQFQIHKRTKSYIWIQWRGHANYPDTIFKKKISKEPLSTPYVQLNLRRSG